MLLKLTVPQANAAFQAGVITKWHVEEGDALNLGTPVCDLSIDEFLALQRTKRASLLGSTSKRRRRWIKDGIDHREGRGAVIIRLICAENGMTLKKREASEGQRVSVGDLVAVIGTPDTDLSSTLPDAEARVSVDYPDAEEIDPFE